MRIPCLYLLFAATHGLLRKYTPPHLPEGTRYVKLDLSVCSGVVEIVRGEELSVTFTLSEKSTSLLPVLEVASLPQKDDGIGIFIRESRAFFSDMLERVNIYLPPSLSLLSFNNSGVAVVYMDVSLFSKDVFLSNIGNSIVINDPGNFMAAALPDPTSEDIAATLETPTDGASPQPNAPVDYNEPPAPLPESSEVSLDSPTSLPSPSPTPTPAPSSTSRSSGRSESWSEDISVTNLQRGDSGYHQMHSLTVTNHGSGAVCISDIESDILVLNNKGTNSINLFQAFGEKVLLNNFLGRITACHALAGGTKVLNDIGDLYLPKIISELHLEKNRGNLKTMPYQPASIFQSHAFSQIIDGTQCLNSYHEDCFTSPLIPSTSDSNKRLGYCNRYLTGGLITIGHLYPTTKAWDYVYGVQETSFVLEESDEGMEDWDMEDAFYFDPWGSDASQEGEGYERQAVPELEEDYAVERGEWGRHGGDEGEEMRAAEARREDLEGTRGEEKRIEVAEERGHERIAAFSLILEDTLFTPMDISHVGKYSRTEHLRSGASPLLATSAVLVISIIALVMQSLQLV